MTIAEKAKVRDIWYHTCLDIQAQCSKRLMELENDCECRILKSEIKIEKLRADLSQAFKDYGAERRKRLAVEKELAEVKAQLETEQAKNQELAVRINKDYSNSSESSSMSPNHKTIHNSRKKSGLKPGGQRGHIHHGRKLQEPTER